MVYLHTDGIVVADTHAQAGILLSYQLLDMPQTIVTAIGAVRLQAESPYRQCYIITHYEQTLLVDILLVQPETHGITAEIHKRCRLQQEDLSAFQARLCHKAIALVLKNDIGRFSESVQYHPSCIVAGLGILVAGITQSYN